MRTYKLEILNAVKNPERDIKADGFEHTELGRINFYRSEETNLKKGKKIVASYPADSINILDMTKTEEEEE